jgi:leucyl aminopeptidase
MSGKSIEIIDTDAEGRVILADALTYAKKYKPRLVVDVATLTGASLVALGQHASAFLTTESDLQVLFDKLGEESGDYMWPLPLWSEYEEYTKGVFADVANIPATGNTHYGGAINGGAFLYQFAKDYTWAHIDMAPRMTTIPSDNLAKGAAGAPVRFLTKLVEKY